MKLIATPLSHFSRKVRFLLDHFNIPYELIDIGNVAVNNTEKFSNNPLMKAPTLIDEENWMIESDHIASYLIDKYDSKDSLQVFTKNIFDLNARAVMNGIMSEEVKVIIAKRTLVPIEKYEFFGKALSAISNGLDWLEANHQQFDPVKPKYRDIHLVCMWDHLEYYDFLPLTKYRNLKELVEKISHFSRLKQTAPRVVKPK